MRVIAGIAKGHRLQSVRGDVTRPITDRAKEALFSILGDFVVGARVLDLFAGTGAVGIEALSRGAAQAVFVDRSPAGDDEGDPPPAVTDYVRQLVFQRGNLQLEMALPGAGVIRLGGKRSRRVTSSWPSMGV